MLNSSTGLAFQAIGLGIVLGVTFYKIPEVSQYLLSDHLYYISIQWYRRRQAASKA